MNFEVASEAKILLSLSKCCSLENLQEFSFPALGKAWDSGGGLAGGFEGLRNPGTAQEGSALLLLSFPKEIPPTCLLPARSRELPASQRFCGGLLIGTNPSLLGFGFFLFSWAGREEVFPWSQEGLSPWGRWISGLRTQNCSEATEHPREGNGFGSFPDGPGWIQAGINKAWRLRGHRRAA